MKRATPIGCAAVMGAMSLFGGSALADVTLVDQNSSITINPSNGGVLNWIVDNKDYLKQHWFWYRAGTMAQAAPISSLQMISLEESDINGDLIKDTVSIAYQSTDPAAPFTAYVWLSLTGSEPYGGGSSLQQIVTITNDHPTSSLSMQFYQYADLDLAPTGGTETAWFMVDGPGMPVNTLTQYASDGSVAHSATVISPPNGWDMSGSTTLLTKLNTDPNTSVTAVLGRNPGPVTDVDVAWGWGWDLAIPKDDSFTVVMSEDVTPISIPLPSSVWMGGMMLVVLGGGVIRRQRRRSD